MGSVGDAYDNALCESFFATLEYKLLDRQRFRSQVETRLAIFDFIEGWYNLRRRRAALDYLSPLIFERADGKTFAQLPQDPRSAGGSLSRYPPERSPVRSGEFRKQFTLHQAAATPIHPGLLLSGDGWSATTTVSEMARMDNLLAVQT
jgi:hypothetical protein